jgi:hypothetical protein
MGCSSSQSDPTGTGTGSGSGSGTGSGTASGTASGTGSGTGGGTGGSAGGGAVTDCVQGEQITETCRCGEQEYGEGWCCATGFSEAECLPVTLYYVLEGATGSGDGSTWADAFTDLPATLERGAAYMVGDGSYAGYTFDDPESGDQRIQIRKAMDSLHGTDVGWQPEHGDGQAVFGPLEFQSDYYLLDGAAPYGLKAVGGFQGLVADLASDHVTLRHVELDGNYQESGGNHTGGACNVTNVNGSYVTLDRCDLHNAADDGVGVYGDDITIVGSRIHNLHGCGTDGACGPCYNGHSDGIELQATTNVTLVGNLIYDIESTGALIAGQWAPGNYTTNLVMINNVLYTPATGLTALLSYITGAKVYHNVIWGRTQGNRYGGLAIGPELTDFEMHNNIILSINYSHLGGTFDPTEHDIDYNLFAMVNTGEYTLNTNDVVGDPLFAAIVESDDMADHIEEGLTAADFALTSGSPAIDSGMDLSGIVDDDLLGAARPADGDGDNDAAWDRGPIEYTP